MKFDVQLKIVLCILSLLSIAFLVPSDVYANNGGKIVEQISLEHDIEHGVYNSLVQIDSDTYALAYTSNAKKGWISTFTISEDGTSIVEVDTLNYSGGNIGRHNSLVHVTSDTYALAHSGAAGDGYISTFTISSDGATITALNTLEHDEYRGQYNSLVQVDSDTYALAYAGEDSKGYISTFTISSDGLTITEEATLEHDANNGMYNSLVQVDSDTYALAYTGYGNDGYISTFTISSDGTSIVKYATIEHDVVKTTYNSLVHVTSNTYALAYTGDGNDGYISTFTIGSNGDITPIRIQNNYSCEISANLKHSADLARYNSLVHVAEDNGSHTLAFAYAGGDTDGYIATFSLSQLDPSSCSSSSSKKQYAPHIHDEVTVSINSNEKFNLNFKDKKIPKITSRVGDTVDITISVGDDKKLDQITLIEFLTNFAKDPGINKYFANNYNDYRQVPLSVYEWYQHKDDIKYDYDGTVSWNEPSTMMREYTGTHHEYVGSLLFNEEELIIVFSLNMTDVMDETQTIIKILDAGHKQKRSVLPFTLEVLPELAEAPSAESVEEIESPVDDKSKFFIKSNKSSYENGNKVVIKGQIPIQNFDLKRGQNIKFSITSPENEVILSGKFAPKLDGSFIYKTFATDSKWKTDGDYIFNFNFGSISSNLVLSYDNSQFEKVDLVPGNSFADNPKFDVCKVINAVEQDKKMKQKKWDFHISVNSDSYLGTCDGRTYITISDKPSVPEEHKSTQLEIAAFVDQSKDPQHYIDRYFNESKYKKWFDKNYPQYTSIYEAVGLEQPVQVIEKPVKEKIVEIKTGKYISRR